MLRLVIFIFSMMVCFTLISQRVLVIGIDGCRADVAEIANTPNLDVLKSDGIYSADALNDDITISGPGWSAIVCGVWSDKHLVTNNNFTGNNYAQYPSFFQRIEAHNPDLNTVSICHWSPINNNIVQTDADLVSNVSTDQAVADGAINQLTNKDPHAIFLHFDDLDIAGHNNGFAANVPAYVSTLETTDTHIGDVIDALQNRPNYITEDWIVIITSDHGGINFSHGGTTFEEQNVPFIVSGPSVAPQEISKDSSFVLDEAINCLNDSTELKFDGSDDYVSIPHISGYDFGTSQDFTLECRVRTTEAADVSIIGNKNWDSGFNKGIVFSFKIGGPEWKVNIGDGSNRADINLGGSVADNQWHTLSVSFDRDGMMKMYEDGVFIAETSISSIGDIDNGENIFFGADINQAYDYNGSIAEVRMWNKVLTAQEISNHYCNKINANHPSISNLIGYWQMNEGGSSSQINDSSPNNNNGTIVSAEWYTADSMWIYNYDNTPRIVDASINALAHLCVPIELGWNLDGNSLVPDCVYNIPECANPGKNEWIGPDNGFWEESENWSRNFSPIICDNVIIPAGKTIILKSTTTAECHTLKIEDGGNLEIENGGKLDVTK